MGCTEVGDLKIIFSFVLSCVFQILYGKHNFIYLYVCEWVWMSTCCTACVEVRRLSQVSCGHYFPPFFEKIFLFFTAVNLAGWSMGFWGFSFFAFYQARVPWDYGYALPHPVVCMWVLEIQLQSSCSSPHVCTASTLSTIHLPSIILWPEVMIYTFFLRVTYLFFRVWLLSWQNVSL